MGLARARVDFLHRCTVGTDTKEALPAGTSFLVLKPSGLEKEVFRFSSDVQQQKIIALSGRLFSRDCKVLKVLLLLKDTHLRSEPSLSNVKVR
jgi:hypothetical protein